MPSHTVVYVSDDDQELFKKFEEIRWREHKSLSKLMMEAVKEYLEHHGAGNFQYTLDNPVICTPALFRDSKIIHDYMMKCKDDEFSTHKFKLNEWNHAFKQRYGEYP